MFAWQTSSLDARLNTQGCGGIRDATRDVHLLVQTNSVIDLASLVLLLLSLTAEIFGTAWILSCADNLNGFLEYPTECTLDSFQES